MGDALPGSEAATFDLGYVEATVAISAGPRILGYARHGGPQLFARLPGEVIEHPAIGVFSFLGGHRLWRAPELPAVTYQPDDRQVVINRFDDGLELVGPPDTDGVAKVIRLHQHDQMTVVDHTLRNKGTRSVGCAAWAITQLSPGGLAILPQSLASVDADGVLPNRSIVLWPYTDPSAPEIEFRPTELRVRASKRPTKTKVGQANRLGWLAYLLGDELFVKWSPLHKDGFDYTDLGSSLQCFRNQRFLELETLSPLTELEPGQELHHREVWQLIRLTGERLEDALASLPLEAKAMVE